MLKTELLLIIYTELILARCLVPLLRDVIIHKKFIVRKKIEERKKSVKERRCKPWVKLRCVLNVAHRALRQGRCTYGEAMEYGMN